ncbi:thiolase C-terminal domain-containing protein [Gordonia humi]|uniref:propanoyl-CoA C-acyltransferase n=1 Tax=Gordonia humi TaxID=686429 RepID=A0A840EQ08_9ACTN|nr:acetyl-CoA acetyltransferase [Gordonia humi]
MIDAYVIGAYSTPFGKHPDQSFTDLADQAVRGALRDADRPNTTDGPGSVWFGNMMMDHWGQRSSRGHFTLLPLMDAGALPGGVGITNVEGACATGSMALQGAVKDVRSGEHALSLAIGVEKIVRPDAPPSAVFDMYRGADNSMDPSRTLADYDALMAGLGRRFETGPDRTMFMDTYAAQALDHMARYGTTRKQFAAVAAKNHNYAVNNARAQYRFPMTVDEVLADRLVTDPLTRSMCAPVGDGAAAVLVASGDLLRRLPAAVRRRAVRIAASTLTSGTHRRADEPGLSHYAARDAYRRSGFGPGDIDVAEVHDATAYSEIFQTEMMGFCARGEGGQFVESGETGPGGTIPINTSGGLLSKGHPVGASGLSMITEVTEQLRGEAGPRQVPGARVGLIENGGGIMGLEEAACAVTILHAEN